MFIGEKTEEDYQEILEELLKKLKNTSDLRDLILVIGVQRWNSLFLIRYIGMF